MLHLDEGTIHGWLDGELSDAERARVERHVAECQQCAAAVAEARGMIAGAARIVSALDSVPGGVIPKAPPVARRPRSLWRTLGVTPARAAFAATLLIAVAATLAKRHDRTNGIWVDQPVRTVTAPAVAPAPRATPPAADSSSTVASPAPSSTARPSIASSSAAASGMTNPVARPRAKVAPEPRVLREPAAITRVPAAAAAVAAMPAPAMPPAAIAPVIAVEPPAAQPPIAHAVAGEAKRTLAQSAAGRAGARDTTMNRNTGVAGGSARPMLRLPVAGAQLDQVVVTSSVVQTGFAGCYRVTSDSLIRAGIPQRFALQVAASEQGKPQNVVRLVAPDGRIDSVLAGGTWRELSPRVANVSFAVGATRTLRLELTPSGAIGGTVEEARQPGAIARASCQP
ncbi:MAG TPA: zf-HC2 domain-containing protein [Gemmatimonadaceae bacterium]